ncbi:MAG: primosomal protein N' [Oscillospiraceae bacterium]|nr:primosomal protein N' [Oscillospiraceae bacterium]
MSGERLAAAVGVSDTAFDFDRKYRYLVPTDSHSRALPGVRVIVPFGKGNRKRMGVILFTEVIPAEKAAEYKLISAFADTEPVIKGEQLSLLFLLKDYTLCTYYEAFKTLIPPGLSVNFTRRYRVAQPKPADVISLTAQKLYSEIIAAKSVAEQQRRIEVAFDTEDSDAARELADKGYIESYEDFRRRVKDETVKMVRLTEGYLSSPEAYNVTPKQRLAMEMLQREGTAAIREIEYVCGVTASVVRNMEKNGVAELYEYEVIHTPDVHETVSPDEITLNEDQQRAFDGISSMISAGKADAALLYGVTGSGKTLVFAKLIKYTIDIGRNVLMLVPEISLTPQTVNRFTALFGDTVSVMHSGLPLSVRLNEYKRIKAGGSRIVIGTRSAVFAPLDNIGLIIVDEEGERTYKSESSPRYNAKDIAGQRCITHKGVLLLASATPSIETYYMTQKGRCRLFKLPHRYSESGMPAVDIIDMCGTGRIFSERLVCEVNENLARGEQSILLLNRRGYNTYMVCSDCKEPLVCPNCSVPVTYHKANNRIMCHYCGFSEEMTGVCPKCGSARLRRTGMGTQKLEEELREFFPDARILRMDADTTYSRYAYDKRFTEFGEGKYDIMVGTQMIAKGLDFPNVTLVGVLNADKSLFSGDFRSYERTFSLIAQVVGRSGRGDKCGRALIQTLVPDHYVINLAAMQNYEAFYEQEAAMRKALLYPPFCDICVIGFSSPIEKNAMNGSRVFAALIKESHGKTDKRIPLKMLGPSKCEIERINGKYRYRIILKCRNNSDFREFIGDVRKKAAAMRELSGVSVYIDINGDIGA